jgi:hypothetical protein
MGYGLVDAEACVKVASPAMIFYGNGGCWIGNWWVMQFNYIDETPFHAPATPCGTNGEQWIHQSTKPDIHQTG